MAKCEVSQKARGFEPVTVTVEIDTQDRLDRAAALVDTVELIDFMGAPWPELLASLVACGADKDKYRDEIDDAINGG